MSTGVQITEPERRALLILLIDQERMLHNLITKLAPTALETPAATAEEKAAK